MTAKTAKTAIMHFGGTAITATTLKVVVAVVVYGAAITARTFQSAGRGSRRLSGRQPTGLATAGQPAD